MKLGEYVPFFTPEGFDVLPDSPSRTTLRTSLMQRMPGMSRIPYRLRGIALLLSLSMSACDDSSDNPQIPPAPPRVEVDADSLAKIVLAQRVFDEDTIRRYDILIDSAALASIDADPMAEQYVEATLVVEGDTMRQVGVRYKGNEGAWYQCVEGGPWGGGGPKRCPLSMQVKVNWKVKDTTFLGLKRFQLHVLGTDDSKLVQRVSYWFFRQMGVPVPRVAHVELWINGVYEGLYAHVEEIDGRFVRAHFPDGSGNLYKEIWPLRYDGTVQGVDYLVNALKTNEEKSAVGSLYTFGQELSQDSTLPQIRASIERHMDIEEAMAIVAVSYTIDDDDGVFHWYALNAFETSSAKPHNFYWYEEPAGGKVHLIPWDLDLTLDKVGELDSMNALELMDEWGAVSHDCENYGYEWRQRSAACDKLVQGLVSYDSLHKAKLLELYNGPFSRVDTAMARWKKQLRTVLTKNQDLDNGTNIGIWEDGVTRLEGEMATAKSILAKKVGK